MGIIRKEIDVKGNKGITEKLNVLFDTGSSISLIRKDIAERISKTMPSPFTTKLITAKGDILETKTFAPAGFYIKKCLIVHAFDVSDEIKEDMVVGVDIMQNRKLIVDMEKDDIDTSKCEELIV